MAPALATAPTGSLAAVLFADGALRDLGRDLDEAWRDERAAAGRKGEQLRVECERIARQILAVRARTADGLKVKARAILWAHSAGQRAMVADLPDLAAVKAALKGVLALA
ncbi:MAG: hypothetical protein ABSC25_24375 [Roseiarcus sp.]|jgi:hypothetical protein